MKNIFYLLFSTLLFCHCKKEGNGILNPPSNIDLHAIFYKAPTTNIDKPSAYAKIEMPSTGDTMIISGKFDEEGNIKTLSSILHDKVNKPYTFCAFFSDSGDEMIAFRLSENNVKDSLVLRLFEFGTPDSVHYQLYLYNYNWETQTGELLQTIGYDDSGITFRGDEDDKFQKNLKELLSSWAPFDFLFDLNESTGDFQERIKQFFEDFTNIFKDKGAIDELSEYGEDIFNDSNTEYASLEDTEYLNNEINDRLDFGNDSAMPTGLENRPTLLTLRAMEPQARSGKTFETLNVPLKVLVYGLGVDNFVSGVEIEFLPFNKQGQDHGSFNPPVAITDQDGIAQTLWILGSTVGEQSAIFKVKDRATFDYRWSGPSWFEANVTAGPCSDGIQNPGEDGVDCGGPCPPCPPGCNDGIQNGNETGVDCGGDCGPCPPNCNDGIQNGGETGVDCGGPCPPCPSCNDGIQNQGESGVDCGGPCPPCPSCNDGVQNQGETGVDCGGPCPPCPPTCNDGIQNGDETGVDCGGSCAPCGNNLLIGTWDIYQYTKDDCDDLTNEVELQDVLSQGIVCGYSNSGDLCVQAKLTITQSTIIFEEKHYLNGNVVFNSTKNYSYTIDQSNEEVELTELNSPNPSTIEGLYFGIGTADAELILVNQQGSGGCFIAWFFNLQ